MSSDAVVTLLGLFMALLFIALFYCLVVWPVMNHGRLRAWIFDDGDFTIWKILAIPVWLVLVITYALGALAFCIFAAVEMGKVINKITK